MNRMNNRGAIRFIELLCKNLGVVLFAVELVLFCRLSELQLKLYRQLLSSRVVRRCIRSV